MRKLYLIVRSCWFTSWVLSPGLRWCDLPSSPIQQAKAAYLGPSSQGDSPTPRMWDEELGQGLGLDVPKSCRGELLDCHSAVIGSCIMWGERSVAV